MKDNLAEANQARAARIRLSIAREDQAERSAAWDGPNNRMWLTMPFSKDGMGILLANAFDRAVLARPHAFPTRQPRGQSLLIAADFGGSHSGQLFDTYAFLNLRHGSQRPLV